MNLICNKCGLREWNMARQGEYHTARRMTNGRAAKSVAHNGEVTCDGILIPEKVASPARSGNVIPFPTPAR